MEGCPPTNNGEAAPAGAGAGAGAGAAPPLPCVVPLDQRNAHPLDSLIEFDEGPHVYSIRGSSEGWISVTSLVKKFFEDFDGVATAQKMVKNPKFPHAPHFRKYAKFVWDGETLRKRCDARIIRDIVAEWKRGGEDAARQGTELHEAIEDYLNGGVSEVHRNARGRPEFSYFLDFMDAVRVLSERDEFSGSLGGFPLELYRTEWRVFAEKYKTCGSIDAVFRMSDGTLALVDWKRTKRLDFYNYRRECGKFPVQNVPDCNWSKYCLQLNLYACILEVPEEEGGYGMKVSSMTIVVLREKAKGKRGQTFRSYDVPCMRGEATRILRTWGGPRQFG